MTTVYTEPVAGDDGAGDNNLNIRITIPKGTLSAGSGTQFQVTLLTGTAAWGNQLFLNSMWFGRTDQVANSIIFNGNQGQAKFLGSGSLTTNGGNGTVGKTITSDLFSLVGNEAFDVTKDYLLAFHIDTAATTASLSTLALSGSRTETSAGADESSVTTPVGSYTTIANTTFLLKQIDVTVAAVGNDVLFEEQKMIMM